GVPLGGGRGAGGVGMGAGCVSATGAGFGAPTSPNIGPMSAFILASGGWPPGTVVDASRDALPFASRLTLTLSSPPGPLLTVETTISSAPIVASTSSLHAGSVGLGQPAAI